MIARTVTAMLLTLVLAAFPLPCRSATNEVWFPVGEKLTYKLYWGVIKVGTSRLSSEWVEENGKRYLLLTATARTSGFVNTIYKVDDNIQSVVDPETFLPVRYTQKLKEGRHVRHDTITFDHAACQAYWTSGLTNETSTIEIGPDTRDVLTLTYYMRPQGADIGDKKSFRVLVDDKLYTLELTVLEREKLKLGDFGKVKCLKVEPLAKFGPIFVRKGKVFAWFSDDKHRICTRMEGKVPVANVKAILSAVEGWTNGVWGGSASQITQPAEVVSELDQTNSPPPAPEPAVTNQ